MRYRDYLIKESARLTPITSIGGGITGALIGYLRARNGSKKEKLLNALKWGAGGLGLGYLGGQAADQFWLRPIVEQKLKEKEEKYRQAKDEAINAREDYVKSNVDMFKHYEDMGYLKDPIPRIGTHFSRRNENKPSSEWRLLDNIDLPFYNLSIDDLAGDYSRDNFDDATYRVRQNQKHAEELEEAEKASLYDLGRFSRANDMDKWYDLHTIPANIGNFLVDKLPGMIVGK